MFELFLAAQLIAQTAASPYPRVCLEEPIKLLAGSPLLFNVDNPFNVTCEALINYSDTNFLPVSFLFEPTVTCAGVQVAWLEVPVESPDGDAQVSFRCAGQSTELCNRASVSKGSNRSDLITNVQNGVLGCIEPTFTLTTLLETATMDGSTISHTITSSIPTSTTVFPSGVSPKITTSARLTSSIIVIPLGPGKSELTPGARPASMIISPLGATTGESSELAPGSRPTSSMDMTGSKASRETSPTSAETVPRSHTGDDWTATVLPTLSHGPNTFDGFSTSVASSTQSSPISMAAVSTTLTILSTITSLAAAECTVSNAFIVMDPRHDYMARLLDQEIEQHNVTKSLLLQAQIHAQSWERAYLISQVDLQCAQTHLQEAETKLQKTETELQEAETRSRQMFTDNARLNLALNHLVPARMRTPGTGTGGENTSQQPQTETWQVPHGIQEAQQAAVQVKDQELQHEEPTGLGIVEAEWTPAASSLSV
ncbi:hypothetical protein VM1G_11306 [Cytospora mali]|uniref:Uncharacterized protein n=1 Tax=Cytospora mali TaxID=578113 RepID=A0A194VLK1_CYTMA|nr:hypothetical protein VM1G_11306 [Valsa mali]